jgi:cytochrome c peroxidase
MNRLPVGLSLVLLLAPVACKKEGASDAKPTPAAQPSSQPAAAPAPAPAANANLGNPDKAGVPPTPAGLTEMEDSTVNVTTTAKVALGYTLFFDKRLSKDDSAACAACHLTDVAWATHNAVDTKVGGAKNKRNTPSLLNVGYHKVFYWDGRMPTLEAVANAAWKGQLGAEPKDIAVKLNAVPAYKERFQKAFASDATADNIPQALASFLRALKTGDAAFDRFIKGDEKAFTDAQKRGWKTFQSAGCLQCHVPPLFTDGAFHNIGVGSDKPEAEQDQGRTDATKDAADKGRFKTPSLRNVALTAPYFHDGHQPELAGAIAFMAGGGLKNPNLDPLLRPQTLTDADKADLKAFLEGLTGKNTFDKPATDIP